MKPCPDGPPAQLAAGRSFSLAGIGLGANLGKREARLLAAWQELATAPGLRPVALSSPWLTAPLGMVSKREFLNAVALVESALSPQDLLHLLLAIEARHGRRRDPQAQGWQDRPLDLDLLFYGDCHLEETHLHLPHPRLHERLFVLAPLAEILPDWRHPLIRESAANLCARLIRQGSQSVRKSRWSHAVATQHPRRLSVMGISDMK